MKTRLVVSSLVVAGLFGSIVAQVPSTAPTNGVPMQAAPSTPSGVAAGDFDPAMGLVRQALNDVKLDRWKLSKSLRDQTDGDIGSIKRDLGGTLPGLLLASDAAAGMVSTMLPVASNVGALYDVLLRVTERAKVAAPPSQVEELVQAQAALETARRSFADRLQKAAVAAERQVVALKQAAKPVVAVACIPPLPTSATAHIIPKKKKKVVPAASGLASPALQH